MSPYKSKTKRWDVNFISIVFKSLSKFCIKGTEDRIVVTFNASVRQIRRTRGSLMEKITNNCLEMILHHLESGYVNQEDPGSVMKLKDEEWVGRTCNFRYRWNDYKYLMLHQSTRRTTGIV